MIDTRYHMRRTEREISDRKEIDDVLAGQKFMTLAMCAGGSPYLATVNYAYDSRTGTFYFHSAENGRKCEYLASNPAVWGQVLEDNGYIEGECDYAYRSVHFWGRAEIVSDIDEKRMALELMIDKLEERRDAAKKEFITEDSLFKVRVYRVRAEGFTAKKSAR